MSDLDALLAGIVANPHESLRWPALLADALSTRAIAPCTLTPI